MDDAELDRAIDEAREGLYALYRERRARREAAAAVLRKPRPPAPELVFEWALSGGLSHDEIAAKFAIKPQKVRELLNDHIRNQSRTGDWYEHWQAEYRQALKLNDTLPSASRLRRRSLWRWKDSAYGGVRYDDAQWDQDTSPVLRPSAAL